MAQQQQNQDQAMQDMRLKANVAKIKHKIVVMSGKGGVGKSTVSTNIAYGLALEGKKVGLLDADIHGPNIPLMLGIEGKKIANLAEPYQVHENLKVVSLSFYVESSDDPIIWRGPAKTGAIKQLLADVNWGDLDYLVVDLPPGTGDEALTIAQNIDKVDGTVIVTTPQNVALLDSRKSVKFSKLLNMPIFGIVENMSGFICPHCGERVDIFKSGGGEKAAKELNVNFLGKIPMDPAIVEAGDDGKPFIYFNNGGIAAEIFIGIVNELINKAEGETKEKENEEKVEKTGGEKIMRIAFPTNDRVTVEGHFGHCKEFVIFDVEDGKILKSEFLTPPAHEVGTLPKFLHEKGADIIITGGMGQRAVDIFNSNNINVILGANGNLDDVLKEYLQGDLYSTESACQHDHDDGHECNH